MNKNTRRYLTFGGTALISIGAVALILINTTGAAGQATEPVSSAPTSTEVVSVPEIKVVSQESKSGSASAFVPSSGASAAASLTTISKPISTPSKPTPPASSALTDKTKKPSYSSKPIASKKATTTPKNGEVRNGKTWIDGFGWVEGTGIGGGEVTVVSGMHEGGEQVGIMD